MNHDLTVGKPAAVLGRFCLPLLGSVFFQQLYNLADSLVAGQFLGEDALAAVGNSYEVTLIFLAFAVGCSTGLSVVAAQLFGGGRHKEMRTAISSSLIAVAVLCGVMMIGGLCSSRALLLLIQTPEELIADSKLYLDIYIYGLPFLFFYNMATGIFAALGDSRTPFLLLACSSTANIGADVLSVTVCGRGIDGVAWATFLCQGVACVVAMALCLRRLRLVPVEGKPPLFSGELLLRVVRVAIPSTMQQGFISVGNIMIQSVINTFGKATIAGYAAAIKLNNLFTTSLATVGNGVAGYTGQNLGAGKIDRIREGYRASLVMILPICIAITALYWAAGGTLLSLFSSDLSPVASETGRNFLRIVSPFYAVVSVKIMADGVLRGAGLMREFMVDTFTDLLLRVAGVYALAPLWGMNGVAATWPLGWVVGTVLAVIFYARGVRRLQRENIPVPELPSEDEIDGMQ